MENKPDKLDIQQEIDNLKDLYNTSFFDGNTMKKSNFDLFIAIDNVKISPDMKLRDIINNNPISFKFMKDNKTVGLEKALIRLENEDIESLFEFIRRVFEDIKIKAPERVIPEDTDNKEDNGSKSEQADQSDQGVQSKEVEFRNTKYYYFPGNLEKVYRMNDTIMKPSSYTTSLVQYIKSLENETK